jgi:branched-chain amino acid transport system permease protein
VTLGMYGAVLLFASAGLSPLIGIVPVAIISFALGLIVYRVIVRRTLSVKGISAVDA